MMRGVLQHVQGTLKFACRRRLPAPASHIGCSAVLTCARLQDNLLPVNRLYNLVVSMQLLSC